MEKMEKTTTVDKSPIVKICLDVGTETISFFKKKNVQEYNMKKKRAYTNTMPTIKNKNKKRKDKKKKKPNNWIITTEAMNYIKQYVTGKNSIALMKGPVLDETKHVYNTYIRDTINTSLALTDDEYRERRKYIFSTVLTYYNNTFGTSIKLNEFLKFCNKQYILKKNKSLIKLNTTINIQTNEN
jgi:hypothetical protein